MLNITKKIENNTLEYALEGRLDTVTAPDFEKDLRESLGEAADLVINLENVAYISSAGLRVLLAAQKAQKGRGEMKVTHVNEMIMEIFEITGFSEILTIE